jgi:hypothetical protein
LTRDLTGAIEARSHDHASVPVEPDQGKDFKLMYLQDSIALVTGSNRGLGREFAAQLLERGAEKVYATARDPERVQIPGVTPLRLDITDPDSVAGAAAMPRWSSTTPA